MLRSLLATAIVLGTVAAASAETVIVSFSDLESCPPCKQLEQTFRSRPVLDKVRQLKLRRSHVDVITADPGLLRKWEVDAWPTTFLVEMDEKGKLIKIHKRHLGAMGVAELLEFLEVP